MSILFCRECSEGKHDNCDGTALDAETDELTPCTCPDPSHGRSAEKGLGPVRCASCGSETLECSACGSPDVRPTEEVFNVGPTYREQAEATIADLRARVSHYEALLAAVREETLTKAALAVDYLFINVRNSDEAWDRGYRQGVQDSAYAVRELRLLPPGVHPADRICMDCEHSIGAHRDSKGCAECGCPTPPGAGE